VEASSAARLRSRSIDDYLDVRLHLAALSLVAGLIHGVVAIPHFQQFWLFGSFFCALSLFQLGWGVAVHERPSPWLYRVGLAASLAVIALWAITRTTGLPLVPEPGSPEAIGPLDATAVAVEAVLALLCGCMLCPRHRLPAPVAVIRGTVLALMGAGLLALLLGAGHHS
jgi:hypothetical protein